MLILTVIKGPDKGRKYELPDEPALIGRSSEAIQMSDQTISRRHAELTPDEGDWIINDLQSANGTFVNGVRVSEPRTLRPGDQVRAGATLLLFGISNETKEGKKSVRVAKEGELDVNVEAMVKSGEDSMIMAVPEPSQAAVNQLKVFYEIVQLMGSIFDRDTLLNKVMDSIFEHFRPDRGFIIVIDKPGGRPEPVVMRNRQSNEPMSPDKVTISKTIVQHVLKHGVGILSSNAMNDGRFRGGDSIVQYGIRSTLCAPIKFKQRIYGVIHVDSQVANYTFTEDQLRLLTAIGQQTGMALENQSLVQEQIRKERLAAAGETVASLSHSIKNIIQGVRGGADVVELGLKKDNLKVVKGGWDIVARNLERIYSLTTNMLAFSKSQKPELEMTNLGNLMSDIVNLMQGQFDRKGVALLSDHDSNTPPIPIDAGGIHQAVLNLLANALDAVEGETGHVSLITKYLPEQDRAAIQVIDNGPGIDPQVQPHLFQPFQSTKGMRGTGLGLTVTKKILDQHGGTIDYTSSKEEGTTFTITLPTSLDGVPKSGDTDGPGGAGSGTQATEVPNDDELADLPGMVDIKDDDMRGLDEAMGSGMGNGIGNGIGNMSQQSDDDMPPLDQTRVI